MNKLKIGLDFHTGEPSNANGLGDYRKKLASNGHAVFAMSADSAGHVKALQDIHQQYPDVPAYAVFRFTTYQFLGGSTDSPNYTADPAAHAKAYWDEVDKRWPKELDKSFVYMEIVNEPDKERTEWLGQLVYHLGLIALQRNYRFCSPAWSAGTPEAGDWSDFLPYIALCANNPDKLAISLHEYTLDKRVHLEEVTPYLMGRVIALNNYCKKVGFALPTVFITEGGWGANEAPVASEAVPQLIQMMEWYRHSTPNVKGFAIWCLDSGGQWSSIARTVNTYLKPLADAVIQHPWDDVEEPEVPPVEPEKYKSVIFLFPQEGNKTEYDLVTSLAWAEYKRTVTSSYDDAARMVSGGNAESYVVVFDPFHASQVRAVQGFQQNGINYQFRDIHTVTGNPLDGLMLGHLFAYRYVLTSPFNSPRSYGLHEGADYDIIGGEADSKVDVLATYAGTVVQAEARPSGYGNTVLLEHMRNGAKFYTRYAHMDRLFVSVGDQVVAGARLGELGATGNASGEHVHFNLRAPGYGLSGYYEPDVVNPAPYLPDASHLPLWAPAADTIDLLPYFYPEADFGPMFEVRHQSGATETFQLQRDTSNKKEVKWYLVKNSQYETFHLRQESGVWYIWRSLDTSAGPAPDYAERPGANRYYTQYENGNNAAKWVKRHMAVGEVFRGPGHLVDFFYKDNCQPSKANSGPATNIITFIQHYPVRTFGPDLVIENIIELRSAREVYFLAKGMGLVAWGAMGGVTMGTTASAIVERISGRPNLKRETGCFSA